MRGWWEGLAKESIPYSRLGTVRGVRFPGLQRCTTDRFFGGDGAGVCVHVWCAIVSVCVYVLGRLEEGGLGL